MSVALAVAVLAGLLSTLNLALTVGVVRRLREQAAQPASPPKPIAVKVMAQPGDRPQPFTAVTTDGESIDQSLLTEGRTLVGFMANGCSSCEERRPEFIQFARRFAGGRDRVLVTVVTNTEDVSAEVAMLAPVARVVLQDRPGTEVAAAFGVTGYPAFAVLEADGTVLTSGTSVQDLDLTPALVGL